MNKNRSQTGLLGFKYLTGNELRTFKEVSSKCSELLESNGFSEIITPVLEEWSLFVGDKDRPVSTHNVDNIFSLVTPSGEATALRYENTMPVCKYVASNVPDTGLKSPLKYFYISSEYRNEKNVSDSKNIRLREFHQVGWELFGIGVNGIPEAIDTGLNLLNTLGLNGEVGLSEVNIIGDIFDDFSVDDFTQRLISRVVDKEDLTRLEKTLSSVDMSAEAKELIFGLKKLKGSPKEVIREAIFLADKCKYEKLKMHMSKLEKLVSKLKEIGISGNKVKINMSIIRNRFFYSGIVFQYYLSKDSSECGGGGEYNNIVFSLGGPKTSAVGAAFGLDRLVYSYANKK